MATFTSELRNGVTFGMVLSILASAVIAAGYRVNPEVWLDQYPPAIRKKYGPASDKTRGKSLPPQPHHSTGNTGDEGIWRLHVSPSGLSIWPHFGLVHRPRSRGDFRTPGSDHLIYSPLYCCFGWHSRICYIEDIKYIDNIEICDTIEL